MTLAINELFLVTPSDTELQVPPFAKDGPLKVLYNDSGAEGLVSLGIKDKNTSAGPEIIYTMPAASYLSDVGEIYVVLATGTTVSRILGSAHNDQTP